MDETEIRVSLGNKNPRLVVGTTFLKHVMFQPLTFFSDFSDLLMGESLPVSHSSFFSEMRDPRFCTVKQSGFRISVQRQISLHMDTAGARDLALKIGSWPVK